MSNPKAWLNKTARPVSLAVLIVALAVLALAGRDQTGQLAPDVQKYHAKEFRVYRVVDGDTIDLDVPDADKAYTRVRLWGLDTPETKAWGKPVAYFGPEATAFTEKMVSGKIVRIELEPENTRGKFGRLLAFVYNQQGELLNEELLRAGMAYFDDRWRHRFYFRFQQTEAQARKNKVGLWQDAKPEDMPRHVRERLDLSQ